MITLPEQFPVNFVTSEGTYKELHSPNDLRPLTKVQYAQKKDLEGLLKKLPHAKKTMRSFHPHQRAEILKKVASLIQENAPKLAWLIATEGGKPLKDAQVEVQRAQSTLELCAEETLKLHGEVIPMGRSKSSENHMSFTTRDPIGAVLAISAFNHPLNLLAHQVGCAIGAGCPVVIKPAPSTPLCAFKLEKYFSEAGLPSDCLFVVNADVPEIEFLASSPVFDYVSFIGSAKVGWNLRKVIAPGTRLGLEHGGIAPAIVRADADLKEAVKLLIKGSFYHAGQVCISTQRIFVEQNLYQDFVKNFESQTQKLITGDATHEQTDVGPLIRKKEVERIQSWISEAIQEGAELLCGNETSGKGQYLLPTILLNADRNSKVMKEEIFGPVVCINSYEDEEELLDYLNQSDYIFEASLFTKDIQKALTVANNFSTMTMVINNHNAFRVDWMPFGGHKLSGLGMGGVKYMMEEMTRIKQIIMKL